jgi:hypothetical protein
MTEPIKLPPFPWVIRDGLPQMGNDKLLLVEDYARLAVEQATADLREKLAKAEALNDQWAARAKTWLASPEGLHQLEGYRSLAEAMVKLDDELTAARCQRDEARAELARLTTPADVCDTPGRCSWHPWCAENNQCLTRHLEKVLPLPPVKETK